MMSWSWRKHLPPAPRLPRALLLTGGMLLLALLSYGFRAELWPNHPTAASWSLVLLPVGLVVALLQLLHALLNWLVAVEGPVWLRLIVRSGVAVGLVGTALLIGLGVLGSLIALAILF